MDDSHTKLKSISDEASIVQQIGNSKKKEIQDNIKYRGFKPF